jgi:hypothetical protein
MGRTGSSSRDRDRKNWHNQKEVSKDFKENRQFEKNCINVKIQTVSLTIQPKTCRKDFMHSAYFFNVLNDTSLASL